MLKKLIVSNLAVVEKAEAEFGPGLNVLTGETGAGKSVLMGALGLVLGHRADPGIVREGAAEAEVEAVFGKGIGDREQGTGEEVTIRRTVTAGGKSRAWINDESVSIAELKAFAEKRVDIHGPQANQQILEESFQREAVDSFGGIGEKGIGNREKGVGAGAQGRAPLPADPYQAVYEKYVGIVREEEELRGDSRSSDEVEVELEMLRYQVKELEEAHLSDDDETLAERHAALAHAGEIVEAANEITEVLGGDRGAAELLAGLQPRFRSAAKHFPAAEEWAKTAEELTVGIQELSRTVADAVSSIDADPATLDELDARLSLVNRLKRKYGDPAAKLKEKKARLAMLEGRGERLEELAKAKAKVEGELRSEGAKLTAKRKKAAEQISKKVTAELKDLGFHAAKFFVELEPIAPAAHGCDRVVFRFEPNPGEGARDLADVASSGEAARVMLAIKAVLAAGRGHAGRVTLPGEGRVTLPGAELLVFDEVDANIGGEIGAVVGAKMRAVARDHQVIAITHLPQSAVFGERHLVVSKGVSGGRTRTTISSVEGDARITEIARMLGGENITSVVRNHAEELLKLSR